MVVTSLIQTPENVENATVRMVALGNGEGKQSVAIRPLRNTNPLRNPIRNQHSPYRSRTLVDPLSNRPSGSSPLRLSLLLTSNHLNSRLHFLLVRQYIVRTLRITRCRLSNILRWVFHLRTHLCMGITLQRTPVHIRIPQLDHHNQRHQ